MAEDLFRTAVAKDPQQVAAWVGLGNALCQEGRAGEAVECFNKALAIEPHDTGTIANRAWARLAAGDRAGAVADLAAIKEQEGSPDPSLVRAVMEPEAAGDGQR
jgi:Flp pilus assembly protein TadD